MRIKRIVDGIVAVREFEGDGSMAERIDIIRNEMIVASIKTLDVGGFTVKPSDDGIAILFEGMAVGSTLKTAIVWMLTT